MLFPRKKVPDKCFTFILILLVLLGNKLCIGNALTVVCGFIFGFFFRTSTHNRNENSRNLPTVDKLEPYMS